MRLILVFLMLVGVAFADREGGPYIGVGYGLSKYNSDDLYEDLKTDTSKALTIYGGAYINKYFSVEIDYTSFDSWHQNKGYEVDDDKSLSYSITTVNTMAHYPFFDNILDTYAKFGVGQIDMSGISSGGFVMSFGGGIGVRLTDSFSMKIACERYTFEYKASSGTNHDMHIDYLYSGMEFQF